MNRTYLGAKALTLASPGQGTALRMLLALVVALSLFVPPSGVASSQTVPTFIAQEVFAPESLVVPPTLRGGGKTDKTPVPAGLPAGSIAQFVISGVVDKVDGAKGEWQIGNQRVFVYNSAATRIDGAPQAGDLVRVIGLRTLEPGPIVAERVTLRATGPQAPGLATVDMEFLFNGTVSAASPAAWTVGDVSFITNDPLFPTTIDAGLGVGSAVTVQFIVGEAAAPAPQPAPEPAPQPATNEVRFTATVMSISGDVWRIGDFMISVDANTRLDGNPGIGSQVEVRVQAQADGTTVATEIKNRRPGATSTPLFPGPASGPGYGVPLTVSVPTTQLLLDRVGQAKGGAGQSEVKDRQYEANGLLPVTIDDISFMANEIKVVSNLKIKGSVGQYQGTLDIDIDNVPGGHLTLELKGSASMSGGAIMSGGTFRVAKSTGDFALIRSEGTYVMTLVESGSTFGSPVTLTFFASGQ
ncbi:MAG: hypothetical protein HYY01_02785 [Chloroflexi bacterium]|nr:hypothetical protein [Chloroflexota bacterium]